MTPHVPTARQFFPLAAAEAAVADRHPRDPARDVVAPQRVDTTRAGARRARDAGRRRSRRCARRSRGSSPTSRGRKPSGMRGATSCAGSSRTSCADSTHASSTPSGNGARRSASFGDIDAAGRATHDDAPRRRRPGSTRSSGASAWWDWLIAQEKIAEREQARAAFLALDGVARTLGGRARPARTPVPAVAAAPLAAEKARRSREITAQLEAVPAELRVAARLTLGEAA